MKTKIITTLGLMVALSSFGQGLVSFQNANVSAQRITTNGVAIGGGIGSTTTAANSYQYQLFYGPDVASLTNSVLFVNSTTSFGIILGNSSLATLIAGGSPISAQAFGWTFGLTLAQAQSTFGAYWGNTPVITTTAATSPAPGTPLFGSTASATQFTGFVLNVVSVVPEPSTMVLAGLGAASLLLFRRRKQA